MSQISAVGTQTSAVAFRQNLGEMLNQVQYRHDSVVINKDGQISIASDTPALTSNGSN